MKRTLYALGTAGALLAACSSGGSHKTSKPAAYNVTIRPQDFSADVTNPWFPLTPGTTLIYTGVKDGEKARGVFKISDETQKVGGVTCRVVLDRLYVHGAVVETTRDYYAQDLHGNVWYFGEDTAELETDGAMVGTEGTFHSGISGAQPGIYITATPVVGDTHRQEYFKGHAEDFFSVLDLSTPISVPYGSFPNALRTKEWTPLEPDVIDNKYYVKGLGEVKETAVKGPKEEFVLVQVLHG